MATPSLEKRLLGNKTLAAYLVLGSDAVLFSCLLGAYFVYKAAQPMAVRGAWTAGRLPEWGTLLLVTGSFCLLGFRRTAFINVRAGRGLAKVVALMGVGFLVLECLIVQRLRAHGVLWRGLPYNSLLYTFLAYQAVHVLSGIGVLIGVTRVPLPEGLEWFEIAPLVWHWTAASGFVIFIAFFVRHL